MLESEVHDHALHEVLTVRSRLKSARVELSMSSENKGRDVERALAVHEHSTSHHWIYPTRMLKVFSSHEA